MPPTAATPTIAATSTTAATPTASPGPRGPRRAGRRWPGRLGAVVGVLVVGAAGLGGYSRLDREPAESRPVAAALPTRPVTRSDLVNSVQVSGRLGFAGAYRLVGQRSGTVTWVPRPGAVVGRGERILGVDLRPIPLLFGSVPFYRPLAPGSEGADVRQLERNLVELDHADPDDLTVDDSYTAATARAVRRWQDALGVDETGRVAAGDALVAPGSVRVGTVDPLIGQPTGPGAPVLTGTGTGHSVQVDLQLSYRALVRVGQLVRVQLPNGRTVDGRVSTLGSTAEVDSGQAPNTGTAAQAGGQPTGCQGTSCPATAPVEIGIDGPEDRLGGVFEGQVTVTFPAETRRGVLSVPIEALTVGPDGAFAVVVVDPAGRRIVPVRPGMFTAGRVEVSAEGLVEGSRVEVPA
ncbi:peptidoglycan hydrolase-like protein with peptidoglycan-binding domain [Plantactinospora soyae]|uniref:Peptidoglycan hydrolase-like protein with peptidoglycan-binding domain n=2 Tax=Plantactinospora soyae TaxID=1544732 RepID=A0A927QWM1_9ACTN|nr:peptidoglycan hydrolase-like protein with peptidoglycan-binding domain [Plantactinospora soyae]